MAKLDLFSGREPHVIELEVDGQKKEYRIPSDYTEEEIERVLELEARISESKDLKERRDLIFGQLHILFRHYQPDITIEEIKRLLTFTDALKIINFMASHTFTSEKDASGSVGDGKKKEQPTS